MRGAEEGENIVHTGQRGSNAAAENVGKFRGLGDCAGDKTGVRIGLEVKGPGTAQGGAGIGGEDISHLVKLQDVLAVDFDSLA